MSTADNNKKLLHKILDKPFYNFSEVAIDVPILETTHISNFAYDKTSGELEIVNIVNRVTSSSSAQQQYHFVVNEFTVEVKNNSLKPINDFVLEIRLPLELVPREYLRMSEIGFQSNGTEIIKTINVNSKIYPNQTLVSEKFNVEINNSSAYCANKSDMVVKIFSDTGVSEIIFNLSEQFIVSNEYGQKLYLKDAVFR